MLDTTGLDPVLVASWFVAIAQANEAERDEALAVLSRPELEAMLCEAVDTLFYATTGRRAPGDKRR